MRSSPPSNAHAVERPKRSSGIAWSRLRGIRRIWRNVRQVGLPQARKPTVGACGLYAPCVRGERRLARGIGSETEDSVRQQNRKLQVLRWKRTRPRNG
jgi:hypothetical protein